MTKNPGAPSLKAETPTASPKRAVKNRVAPAHFPHAQTLPTRQVENEIPNARRCEKCGKHGRVISNYTGVSVHCTCGYSWPISSAPLSPSVPMMPSRGFSKHTLIEPDWNAAYDEPSGGSNDSFGPKSRGK